MSAAQHSTQGVGTTIGMSASATTQAVQQAATQERSGTRRRRRWRPASTVVALAAMVTGLAGLEARISAPVAHADLTTQGVDVARTSYDSTETALTPSNVSASDFGQQQSVQLDGQIYATPVIVGNTAFVATENNKAYGVDITTGKTLWTDDLGTPFPATALNTTNADGTTTSCSDLTPNIGSTSTGVYDAATGSVYFTSKVVPAGASVNDPVWYLHSVSLSTGAERSGYPMKIQGTADNAPNISFNSAYQMQRPGLLLANGVVYIGFGAHCDFGKYQGWVMGVNVQSTPKIQTAWVADPGVDQGAGIWMSGGGIVMDGLDSAGNPRIFVTTGNGTSPTASKGTTPPTQLAESIIRLGLDSTGHLKAQDFFSPYNDSTLDLNDTDFGSGAPVALPDSYGTASHQHLMVTAGKDGRIYILDRDNLGGKAQGTNGGDAVVQELGPFNGFWNHPAIYPGEGGYFYVVENSGRMYAFKRGVDASGNPSFSQAGVTSETFGYLSGEPVVTSANGAAGSGVVWVTNRNSADGSGTLRAYSAVPEGGVLKLLWSTPIAHMTKFVSVATSGGRVVEGTSDGKLMVFGRPTTAALSGQAVDFGTVAVGKTASGTATFSATSAVKVTAATVSPAANFSVDTTAIGSGVSLAAGGTLSLPVTFTPTTWGSTSAQLTLTYTDSTGASRTVAVDLHGVGQQTGLGYLPSSLAFGQIVTGSSKTMAVSVVNTGTTSQTITAVTGPSGAFSSPSLPAVGTVLAAQNTLSIPVTFTPTAAGSFTSSIVITTSTGTYTVPISGSAITGQGHMVITPMSLDFGKTAIGTSHTLTFTVSNTGNIPITLSLSKAPVGVFTASNPLPEGLQIGPDDSMTVSVTFAPTAVGPASGAYILDGADGQGHQTVTFTGTGVTGSSYAGPTSATDTKWQLNGSATMGGSGNAYCASATDICLTDTTQFKAGSALTTGTFNSSGIDAKFQVQLGGGTGADGQTFVLLPTSVPATAVGDSGGALGWAGIATPTTAGVAVTFDTSQSTNDPSANFVGVAKAYSSTDHSAFTYAGTSTAVGNLRSGTHNVEVSYYGGLLSVRVDGTKLIDAQVTLPSQVRAGFTAGTGGLTDNHVVRNVSIVSIPNTSDATGPTVSLTSPVAGAVLKGTTTLTATASDTGSGVNNVAFQVDGATVGTDTTSPYSVSLDTTTLAAGSHTITVVATDNSGNVTTTTPITVKVSNISVPTVTITQPVSGATCTGQVPITATVTGGTGTITSTVSVDGKELGSVTGSAVSVLWDTTAWKDGVHHILVSTRDSASQTATAKVNCRTKNPPTTAITSPKAGATLKGTVALTGTAVGATTASGGTVAISKVTFTVNGQGSVCKLTKAPWTCTWSTTKVSDGKRTVTMTVVDKVGHASSQQMVVTVKNH